MLWCLSCILLNTSAFLLVVSVLVYLYFKHAFQYWTKRGIPQLQPTIPYGDCKEALCAKSTLGELYGDWYKKVKARGEKHLGFYLMFTPHYIPVDIELIKTILVKEFQYFQDRTTYQCDEFDPLSAHLLMLKGQKWKNLRNKLSPTFTSGKLKKMFPALVDCSENLKNCLNDPASKDEPVDIRYILSKFTIDVIGSVAFGIECNSFQKADNEFYRIGMKVTKFTPLESLKLFLIFIMPRVAEFFKLRLNNREVEAFYMKLVKETIEYREKNNVQRNDFMQLLIQLKNNGVVENDEIENKETAVKLTVNEVVAQAFLFFIAGYDTSSNTMSFVLYELALHQDIQEKVREEIVNVSAKHNGEITYESIMEMHYLERVVQETLRMHPPSLFIQRVCTKEYQIPDTDYLMETGTKIIIPTMGVHFDPEFYPEPEKFNPDHFTEENKATRPNCAFLPFGEGPRVCIGLRFAMMQSKVGLSRLLQNYRFKLNPKTRQPLKLDPSSFDLFAEGGIWLDVEKCS